MSHRPIIAKIDLAALKHNLYQVKLLAPRSHILAMVKANAYGHGLTRIANALSTQLSADDGLGVASLDEAILLREAGIKHPIVLLEGVFSVEELQQVKKYQVEMVIHSFLQLDWVINEGSGYVFTLWIKVDTGMHRLGFLVDDLPLIQSRLKKSTVTHKMKILSHFASADESYDFTLMQMTAFNQATLSWNIPKSLANSAAIRSFPDSHLDWVRPGIMLYGQGSVLTHSLDTKHKQPEINLKPVMSLVTKIIALTWIEAGEAVGYGQEWVAPQKSLIAVIAVGYGDGYPRHASSSGNHLSGVNVMIRGQLCPVVGRVSMDMTTVDVTALSVSPRCVSIGDSVELWGQQVSVDLVAQQVGTIGYELLCGVTSRVQIVSI